MLFPDFCYVEVVTDRLTNRNNIVSLDAVTKLVSESTKRDCYRSFYRHTVEFQQYVARNKTVSGWDGEVYTDYLWLDVDRADLEKAHETAKYMVGRLATAYEIPRKSLRVYFSGAKGFHIGIDARLFNLKPSRSVPAQCKSLATAFAGDVEIDLAIYDRSRIFRLSGTINSKTGLYKIPLTHEELEKLTIVQIKELAEHPRQLEFDCEVEIGLLAYMLDNIKSVTPTEGKHYLPVIRKKSLHGTKICLWKLLHGVNEGVRDEAAIRLAADFEKKGMPEPVALSLLCGWNQHNNPPLDDVALQTKVVSAYGKSKYDFGCNDHVLEAFCHEDCFLFRAKDQEDEQVPIYSLDELETPYIEYIKTALATKVHFPCMPAIDKVIRGVRPGEVCIIMARPGVGKSLIAQTIIHDLAIKQGMKSVFFSIEMPKEQVYERAASIATGWSPVAIEEMYTVEDFDQVSKEVSALSNILVVDKANLSLGEIVEVVERVDNVGMIAIDYLSLVRSPGNSLYERTSYVARQLKTLAKESNAAVLMLSQVSRKGGDGTQRLSLEDGRDSGAIEEGTDFLIAMWRDDSDTRIVHTQLLKGRRGGAGTTDDMTFAGEGVRLAPVDRHYGRKG